MIIGIGIDLIAVERIKKASEKQGFLERYFSKAERVLFKNHKMNPQTIAGNFCVKEAVVKMLGTGFGRIQPIDVEVLRNQQGKPYVELYRSALEMQKELGVDTIHVSISNTVEYVTAVAIGEKGV